MVLLNCWFFPIIQSIIAGFILILIVKSVALIIMCKFFGKYKHLQSNTEDNTEFLVTYNWLTFLHPIPSISISITRINHDQGDWNGTFNSDILNPLYFKGLYIIKDIKSDSRDGWHEVYFFKKDKEVRIAFNLHYLDNNNHWVNDGGYYITKMK